MQLQGNLEDLLSQLGQDLEQPQDWLTRIADAIVESMKSNAPVDTGRLRNSIAFGINDTSITFGMLYYGPFQNFGVAGAGQMGNIVPSSVQPVPTNGSFYQFKKRVKGLPAQPFFNMDQIADEIATATITALNLD